MKVRYDFHIHSGLSPCAENDNTPANIVGLAAINGLDMVAIADHNAIGNVEVAMRLGEAYGVEVVPAFELQTLEDIHILCLFENYEDLKSFYDSIEFTSLNNNPEIFGDQLLFDEDDNIIGIEKSMLLTSANIYCSEVAKRIKEYNGVAIPAHIDREANGMLAILGDVMPEFDVVELSTTASDEIISEYKNTHLVVMDSDAHTLNDISLKSSMELPNKTKKCLMNYLRGIGN